MTPTFDELASRYQSRRVASDVLAGRRPDINGEHWWWWDPVVGLERLEIERAKSTDHSAEGDPGYAQ